MEKDFLIETTKHLYRLTLLFPKKEPLRYKTREIGNIIFNNYILKERLLTDKSQKNRYHQVLFEIQKDLDILLSQLEIAKYQNWASHFEILELQEKYQKIDTEIKQAIKELVFIKTEPKEVKEKPVERKINVDFNSRQENIVSVLKNKEKIQVKDIITVLPNVTKRTIRRDLNDLMEKGVIKRIGQNNETFYALIR